MMTQRLKFLACGLGAIFLASMISAAASAQTRFVDPGDLSPAARARALHSPLGDRDPWGREAPSGCTWSRIQVPTANGLRWMATEDCDPDMWH